MVKLIIINKFIVIWLNLIIFWFSFTFVYDSEKNIKIFSIYN